MDIKIILLIGLLVIIVILLILKSKKNNVIVNPNNNENTNKYKFLIVDDNDLNNKVFSRLLSKYNCMISVAMNKEECIELVRNNTYDIVFLDYLMPNTNAKDVLVELKNIKSDLNIISLVTSDVDGNRSLEEGFNGYLFKPVNQVQLDNVINNLRKGN